MNKKCVICKNEKPQSEFNKNRSKKDGLQPHCRQCASDRMKIYYHNNYVSHKRKVNERSARVRLELKAKVVEYLQSHPCVDCGESDPVVLDFDHVRGDKDNEISNMIKHAVRWDRIEAEILKCEVRCANDHRRRHWRDRNAQITQ